MATLEGLSLTQLQTGPSHQAVHHRIRSTWNMRGPSYDTHMYNPAPQPVSMFREELPLLATQASRRLGTIKADGTRCQLVLTRLRQQPVACLVTRNLRLYEVRVRAPMALFDGTTLDGELVRLKQPTADGVTTKFLVFDLFELHGQPMLLVPYFDRYQRAVEVVDAMLPSEAMPGLRVEMKPVVPLRQVPELWRTSPTLEYPVDGLVMPLKDAPAVAQTDWSCFKLKFEHTVDLRVVLTKTGSLDSPKGPEGPEGQAGPAGPEGPAVDMDIQCLHPNGAYGQYLSVMPEFEMDPARYPMTTRGETVAVRPAGIPLRVRCEVDQESNNLLGALALAFLEVPDLARSILVEWNVVVMDRAVGAIQLVPVRVRDDKTQPNAAWTVYATICNAMQAIQLGDLERINL